MGWLLGWARRVAFVPIILASALLLFGYQARMRLVDQKGSYCHHLDEHLWTTQAIRMLKTGDLNPHRFTKPSVMVYLDTASFAVGILKAGMKGLPVPALADLREGGYPYYTSASMVRVARQIYALLSMASIGMVGLLARHLYRKMNPAPPDLKRRIPFISAENAIGLLAVGTALLSEFYLRYSYLYLGVDILGCFFALLTISYVVLAPPSTRATSFAVVSGILSGLCLGTKYNLYPIAVPVLLAVLFRYRASRFSLSLMFVVSLVVTFLFTTPYAIFDLPHFVEAAVAEARHYARGHGGHDATPGLSLFAAYGRPVVTAYGPALPLLGLVGAGAAFKRAPKQTLLVLCYPLLLWIYMSGQRVIFTRNLLILQLFVPLFAAVGISWLAREIPLFLTKRGAPVPLREFAVPLVALLALATVPWARVRDAYLAPVESRVDLSQWLAARPERAILMPTEVEFDPRSLAGKELAFYTAQGAKLSELRRKNPDVLIVVPVFEGKIEAPRGSKSEVLWSGGKNRVLASPERFSGSHISDGDPKMLVYRNPWARQK